MEKIIAIITLLILGSFVWFALVVGSRDDDER